MNSGVPVGISSNVDISGTLPQIVDTKGDSTHKQGGNFELPTTSRGRGRPPKNGICAVQRPVPIPRGRGRPPKRGKVKTNAGTGKGRGRPKKQLCANSSDNEHSSNETNSIHTTIKSPKQRGRPRKPRLSDQVQDDNEENDNVAIPAERRKRGRPSKAKPPKIPTGKPRGCPRDATVQSAAQVVMPSEVQSNDEEELVEVEEEQSDMFLIKIVKVEGMVQLSEEEIDEVEDDRYEQRTKM